MRFFYKSVKIIAIFTWILTIAQAVFLEIVKYKYAIDTKGAAAIGIIGGADGPTTIVVSIGNKFFGSILPICPYIAVIATVILFVKRIRHCYIR